MSAVLGMPAVQIMTACQLFVASPPAVGWHPHFGEPGYIFGQNTRQHVQQGNDLRYCGEFSSVDSDRVWAAWTVPPPAPPAELPLKENIAIGDRTPQAVTPPPAVTQADLMPITEYCAMRPACVAAVAFEARLVSSLVDFELAEAARAQGQGYTLPEPPAAFWPLGWLLDELGL
jgi:hypothetical protein